MNKYILYAILILTGLLGTYALIPLFKNLLIDSNVLRPNYKKDMIPVSMGIVFLPMLIINSIILAYFTNNFKDILYIFIFFSVFIIYYNIYSNIFTILSFSFLNLLLYYSIFYYIWSSYYFKIVYF